jgi:hypothetical protein
MFAPAEGGCLQLHGQIFQWKSEKIFSFKYNDLILLALFCVYHFWGVLPKSGGSSPTLSGAQLRTF